MWLGDPFQPDINAPWLFAHMRLSIAYTIGSIQQQIIGSGNSVIYKLEWMETSTGRAEWIRAVAAFDKGVVADNLLQRLSGNTFLCKNE